MKRRIMPYPCIGYCIIDKRGYCVGCGRPPTLGMPETCATKAVDTNAFAPRVSPAQGDTRPEEKT